MKYAGKTDPGLKRSNNQDSFLINEKTGLFIVADGMGGHAGGETASSLAVEKVNSYLSKDDSRDKPADKNVSPQDKLHRDIRKAIQFANREIVKLAEERTELRGMGTTLVLAKIGVDRAHIGHVGDSRIYRVNDTGIFRLTKDHSRVQELIDSDAITEEEAERSPFKNIITKALGGGEDVEPDINTVEFQATDLLLLCTDGLHGVMDDQEIMAHCYVNASSPEKMCVDLVEKVKERGAPDNVTLIIIEGDKFASSVEPLKNAPEILEILADKETKKPEVKRAPLADEITSKEDKDLEPIEEEIEKRDNTIIKVLLVGLLILSIFLYLSQTNSVTYTMKFDNGSSEFQVYKGMFFPTGEQMISNYSLDLDRDMLNNLLTSNAYRKALVSKQYFKSETEVRKYLAQMAIEVGDNLAADNEEKSMLKAIYMYNKAKDINKNIEVTPKFAEVHFKLGNYYSLRRKFNEAYEQYKAAEKFSTDIPGLKEAIANTQGQLLQDQIDRFYKLLQARKFDKANELLTSFTKLGADDEVTNRLRKKLEEAKNPTPEPSGTPPINQ